MSSNTPQGSFPKLSSRWSEIEDKILKEAVARYGVNHWDEVARLIWTRKNAEECRARWAELVPVLHDGLARRESDNQRRWQQQQQQRNRSMTASAVTPEISTTQQGVGYFEIRRSSLPSQQQKEFGDESSRTASWVATQTKTHTRPRSPTPPPSAPIPIPRPRLTSAGATAAATPDVISRMRANTEPRFQPHWTASGSRLGGEQQQHQEYERVAPHPLMPGRPHKSSMSSRNTSTPTSRRGSKDGTA